MDLTFTDEQLAFRDELRAWLRDNPPGDRPTGGEDAEYAWTRDWQRRLHEGGWAGVHWPKEVGGRGGAARARGRLLRLCRGALAASRRRGVREWT